MMQSARRCFSSSASAWCWPPLAERQQDRLEAEAEPGCRIFDAGGHFGEDLAADEAMLFHFAQLLDQHFLGDARHHRLQRRQPPWTIEEMVEDNRLPTPGYHFQRALRRQHRQ